MYAARISTGSPSGADDAISVPSTTTVQIVVVPEAGLSSRRKNTTYPRTFTTTTRGAIALMSASTISNVNHGCKVAQSAKPLTARP